MLSVSRFTLNTRDEEAQLSFSVKQGDTARRIIATLTENGEMFCLPDDCYAVFAASKSDGTKFNDSCVIQDGRIIYDLDPQLTLAVGRADCDITVYGRGGAVISTARFTMTVFESIFAGASDEMVSDDTFHVLNNLIGDANDTINDMEELNDAVTAAEAEREEAEAAREEAEQERVDVNTGIVAQATAAATAASSSAQSASEDASLAAGYADDAESYATAAESWTQGGTGSRAGEDTNNAKYWSEQAQAIAGGDFAPRIHTHVVDDITDFPATMPPSAHTHEVDDITDFPETMPPSAHTHNASDINAGTLDSARLPVVPVNKGGTGATTAEQARANLGAASADDVAQINETLENVQSQVSAKLDKAGGTMTGKLYAQANSDYTVYQVRNIALSTSAATPTGLGALLGVYS